MKRRPQRLAQLLLALLTLAALPLAATADELHVANAWVRLPPPATNAAAYLTLHNPTAEARTLVGARSPACERVEIHRSVVENGVAHMEPVERLRLPAGGSLVFEPRGLHLMLIRPRGLEEDRGVEIVLEFENADAQRLEAVVRRHAQTGGHSHH